MKFTNSQGKDLYIYEKIVVVEAHNSGSNLILESGLMIFVSECPGSVNSRIKSSWRPGIPAAHGMHLCMRNGYFHLLRWTGINWSNRDGMAVPPVDLWTEIPSIP